MRRIGSALFTWILRIIGAIEKDKDAPEVNAILDRLSKEAVFSELAGLRLKSEVQKLNKAELSEYSKLLQGCAAFFVKEATRAIVSTMAQLASEWAKGIKFDWLIIDEGTVMSEGQFINIRREAEMTAMMDQLQLGKPAMSKPEQNPFIDQLRHSPYVRLIENNWPFFMLKEVVRITTGLELLCSKLFYDSRLKPGEGTALDHESRAMTRLWQEKTRVLYPSMEKEPDGLAFPICLNVAGQSESELSGGASQNNRYINKTSQVELLCKSLCSLCGYVSERRSASDRVHLCPNSQ